MRHGIYPLALSVFASFCAAAQPMETSDGWRTSTLTAEGIDPAQIAALIEQIQAGAYVNIDGLVIARNGKLVSETYFGTYRDGHTKQELPYDREALHETRSSFKSVTGLLAGIAINSGIVRLDGSLLPAVAHYHAIENTDPRKQRITVETLLNMTSGFDCYEMPGRGPYWESEFEGKSDLIKSHAELPMIDEPGGKWRYCSTNPILFGVVLAVQLEKSGYGTVQSYLDENLMGPLNIVHYRTGNLPHKIMSMHGGQRMRPRDLAKFGQLIVSGGVWDGQQVVPASWVQEIRKSGVKTDWSWTNRVSFDPVMQRNSSYKYLWFRTPLRLGDRDVELIHSWGNGGQFIVAVPEHDLVVTVTASNYGAERIEEQKQIFHMLHKHILPAIN